MTDLTDEKLAEIEARHLAVDADQRFTDKIAHKDRAILLAEIKRLRAQDGDK